MVELFFESPIILGMIGLGIVAGIIFYWTQTWQKVALYCASAAIVVTIILVLISVWTVTDRERIETILNDVAVALRANEHEQIFSHLHPGAGGILARAKTELPRYEFKQAKITHVHSIAVNRTTTPPTAIAEFNVFVQVGIYGQTFRQIRTIKAYFMMHEGAWRVHDYEHYDATKKFRS